MSDDTLLNLDFGIAPYSARGITETLAPDSASQKMRRTVNGTLVDLSGTQFRKYLVSVQCRDLQPPALSGVWPGQIVTVNCITELCHETGGAFERTAVGGSTRTADGFTYYRPVLTMMVVSFSMDTDEWGGRIGWTLELAEV
jgi:hypothetical protein